MDGLSSGILAICRGKRKTLGVRNENGGTIVIEVDAGRSEPRPYKGFKPLQVNEIRGTQSLGVKIPSGGEMQKMRSAV